MQIVIVGTVHDERRGVLSLTVSHSAERWCKLSSSKQDFTISSLSEKLRHCGVKKLGIRFEIVKA